MKIIFTENYLDDKAENSDEEVREQFTAKRQYDVKDSFGNMLLKSKKAIRPDAKVAERVKKTTNFKDN